MKNVIILALIFFSFQLSAQVDQNIGIGIGNGMNLNIDRGTSLYLSYSRSLTNRLAFTARVNYLTLMNGFNRSDELFFESHSVSFQPQIDFMLVKQPRFLFYPSVGFSAGNQSSDASFDKKRIFWGLNTSLNLDVPIRNFLIGGRVAGESSIYKNEGVAFVGYYLTLKYRLRQ